MAPYEHQRSRRCRVSLQARHQTRGARQHEGVVYNLGDEGIFLCTAELFGAGTDLEIAIWLPGLPQEVSAQGRVVWTNAVESATLPSGMGIHFTQVDEWGKARLREHLDRLL